MTTAPAPTSPHFPVRPDWLALREEEILEPALPIVDPHHHLWDRPGSRYFLLDFLADAATSHNIRASVFIECGTMHLANGPAELRAVGETEFANGAAAMSASGAYGECRACAGIVAFADLTCERIDKVLEAQERAAGGRLRGIRQISAWHPDPTARGSLANPPPHLLEQPAFRRGVAAVARLGLSLDTFMYHTQLGELASLARTFPDLPIVVDHTGGAIGIGPYAGRRDEVFAAWQEAMLDLASCPNVHVKLGGFGMRVFGFGFGDREQPASSAELANAWKPFFLTCMEAFGPQRCMFESNFPVDKGSFSYAILWNAFKRVAAGASPDEQAQLFAGTAARVYRLPEIRAGAP
jgi:predicted TIM-barrel fold metal-dependent hydrolase